MVWAWGLAKPPSSKLLSQTFSLHLWLPTLITLYEHCLVLNACEKYIQRLCVHAGSMLGYSFLNPHEFFLSICNSLWYWIVTVFGTKMDWQVVTPLHGFALFTNDRPVSVWAWFGRFFSTFQWEFTYVLTVASWHHRCCFSPPWPTFQLNRTVLQTAKSTDQA